MSKQNPYSFGLGLFIAPFLIFIALLIFAPASPSESTVKAYINNSRDIALPIDKQIYSKGGAWAETLVKGDDAKFSHRVRYYLNFRKNRYKDYAVLYSGKYKKYFVIENYNQNLQNLLNYENEKEITCMVNQTELKDPNNGSIEKPIPILWITKDYELSDAENYKKYTDNVTEYLRFYKNRKKFDDGACVVCAY